MVKKRGPHHDDPLNGGIDPILRKRTDKWLRKEQEQDYRASLASLKEEFDTAPECSGIDEQGTTSHGAPRPREHG